MVTLPAGRFCSFCFCAAVLGVMTLKPEAANMASLFCVLVCVEAQPKLSTMQATATPGRKISFNCFICSNVIASNNISNRCSESNSGSNLRSVCHDVELKVVLLEVSTECPVTDLSEDRTR